MKRLSHCWWNPHIGCYKSNVQKSFQRWVVKIQFNNVSKFACNFFTNRSICFFDLLWNSPCWMVHQEVCKYINRKVEQVHNYHIMTISSIWVNFFNQCCNIITIECNCWKKLIWSYMFNKKVVKQLKNGNMKNKKMEEICKKFFCSSRTLFVFGSRFLH